jgi:hypothetical protein
MIQDALQFLTDEIDDYLTLQVGPSAAGSWTALTNVATEQGNWAIPNDTIGISLINIEEERVMKDQVTAHRTSTGNVVHYNPELKINLYVLISAHFVNGDGAASPSNLEYTEGLKRLSYVIQMFQGKNVFTPDNSTGLAGPHGIKKLIVELYTYSFEQQYNFWSVVGAKYLPSVLYRVRMLTYQEKRPLDSQALIESGNNNLTQ